MWGEKITSKRRKSQFDINMTVVLKSTQQLVLISNFFDNICKMVKKNLHIKIIYSFLFLQ